MITKKIAKKRLQFAKKYIKWSDEDWAKVIFSDETKKGMCCPDSGRVYCKRTKNSKYKPECNKKVIKHDGGNIKLWGCFSSKGTGELYFLPEK